MSLTAEQKKNLESYQAYLIKKREYARRYRESHGQQLYDYGRKYREEHREYLRKRNFENRKKAGCKAIQGMTWEAWSSMMRKVRAKRNGDTGS